MIAVRRHHQASAVVDAVAAAASVVDVVDVGVVVVDVDVDVDVVVVVVAASVVGEFDADDAEIANAVAGATYVVAVAAATVGGA